ncbi:ventricular zone-expressed PH domain-containing protein homolog 1-like isoform X2 [Limulus polyphemus]|uniref:Ventricular zone-expressed PH domain-containing protein homolog 1-like isoform X2 n=1 Tax=Limulus polyphemus TaxID=6850 RepID=A0ABM1T9L0_LIMPO|nr:ventricular zone-expressed PH domain-containing protein homolog 1-like isoform X2 [Limulus polyphemus]
MLKRKRSSVILFMRIMLVVRYDDVTIMHELFAQVLNNRDLSRAGDLFSLDDQSIVDDLSEVLFKIQELSSDSEFILNGNNQSVVEICINRVTSAIRDTGTIEKHAAPLVALLESCLNHDLRPSNKDEDPPHAKIASEIVNCIFLNYSKKPIMKLLLPVAVKFLHRGNKELRRNLSSYLSLAANSNADLLAPHIQPIIDSVISGNYVLAKVLPQIYAVNKEPIHDHVMALVSLLPLCEKSEKISLLKLFSLIAKNKPSMLESNLPQFSGCLTIPNCTICVLQIFLDMAVICPLPFTEHLQKMKVVGEQYPGSLPLVARILGIVGKLSLERGKECLEYLVAQLTKTDHSCLPVLLKEIKGITEVFPILLPLFLPDICSHTEGSTSTARWLIQELKADSSSPHKHQNHVNWTSGGVTTVRVGGSKQDLMVTSAITIATTLSTTTVTSITAPVTKLVTRNIVTGPSRESRGNFANSRHNLVSVPEQRSLSHLLSNPPMNRSLGRLPMAGGIAVHHSNGRLSSPSGRAVSMTRLSSGSGMNKSLTTLSNRHLLVPHASKVASGGGVTVTIPVAGTKQKSFSSIPVLEEESYDRMTVSITSSTAKSDFISEAPSFHPSHSLSVTPATSHSAVTSPSVNGSPEPSSPCSTTAPSTASVYSQTPRMKSSSTSVTVITNSGNRSPSGTQRISVFEPSPMRDAIQHFCKKHLDKIKSFMQHVFVKIPLPVRCTIEERKAKKHAKLHFACQGQGEHCLYTKTYFVMKTKNPRIWIHLMFLALQARANSALSTRETSVSSLRNCWDTLKVDNKTFLTLVTSAFPSAKDQDMLIGELRHNRFFDVFEYNGPLKLWGCFLCNHPDRALDFLQGSEPVIEGQLKEKKAKWKIFRRWRTRYFTLSGAHLSYRGSGKHKDAQPIEVSQIRTVRAISSRGRTIPKAFEIFTNDRIFVLKAKDSKNTEQWVQCLSIALAHSHARVAL